MQGVRTVKGHSFGPGDIVQVTLNCTAYRAKIVSTHPFGIGIRPPRNSGIEIGRDELLIIDWRDVDTNTRRQK
jgi:hypothetical protein